MKTLKQILENNILESGHYDLEKDKYIPNYDHPVYKQPSEELKKRVYPAIIDHNTNKMHVGKRGQNHFSLALDKLKNHSEYTNGFYDPNTKGFITRKKAGFDSTDLMSKSQLFRNYTTENLNK